MSKTNGFFKWKDAELKRLVELSTKYDSSVVADMLHKEFQTQRTATACRSKLEFLRKKGRLCQYS